MAIENSSWFVSKHRVRTDYIKIENLKQWLIEEVPKIHPEHPEYAQFWSKETKKCIEGVWGKEWGKFRYMPGALYFFGNYGIIKHTWEEKGVKITKFTKPLIMDYIWEFAYMSIVAYGFSGFEKDEKYSCNLQLKKYLDGKLDIKYLSDNCFNGETIKEYVEPYEYVSKLHNSNLGKPLFQNEAQDVMVMGTRRGGKSYWVGIGELEYNFIFSGARRFNEDFINKEYSCAQVVGSADTDKSSDLLSKFKDSQDCKTDASNKDFIKWFGIWEEAGFDDKGKPKTIVTPCPFYKRTIGNLDCPNKQTPYTSKYKVEMNGEWKTKGEGNELFHVNYSTKKGSGSQAAVGNSYLFSDVEENGLVENVVEIKSANDAATKRGTKFGVQWFQGTSGNIDFVQASKTMFLNPQDYGMIGFNNVFSSQGKNNKTGYFIPKYVILPTFKDENGNTDYDAAIKFVNDERLEAAQSNDQRVLARLLMNEPNYIEEMWLTDKGYYLPYEEAAERERELMKGQMYKTLGTPVIFKWDEKVAKGVSYDVAHNVEPIYDFPIPKELKDPSGCVVIYEQPIDNPPKDFYLFCCDPYVEEDIDKGGSLAVTYVIKNPKYIALGYAGHFIVASYIGKPSKGLGYYYEQQEKLIQYYGNFPQSFWYDARGGGETLRDYYIRKGKQYILCLRPNHTKGDAMYERHTTTHGVVIGNRDSKKTVLKLANDKLLETNVVIENGEEKIRRNIFRIPCIFLIRQIMQYNLDDNFDAVSSFYIGILGLNETEAKIEKAIKNQRKVNIFESLLKNENIFKQTHNWVQ